MGLFGPVTSNKLVIPGRRLLNYLFEMLLKSITHQHKIVLLVQNKKKKILKLV